MKAKIVIELTGEISDTGSGMPELGHDAYWLMKELPNFEFKESSDKMKPLSSKYAISQVRTEAQPAGG